MGETYAAAGVDIAAGDRAVERLRAHVDSTTRPEVIGGIGGFGGLFDVSELGYDEPVLVSGTDGVGTKAQVAAAAGRYDTIGIDLVAMCVDDLVCGGAAPLFFLDYISVGRVTPDHIEALVGGVADGCRQVGAALVGGEIAEHPGAMPDGEFDLVGFAVGAVEKRRARRLQSKPAAAGDVVIGLPSPGLRSNGYSLARRLFFEVAGRSLDDPAWDGAATSVADELLAPSVLYTPAVSALFERVEVAAVAHVTGGGLPGNLPRSLPGDVDAQIDRASWTPPPVFEELRRIGDVDPDEMDRVFNMGIGMTVVVPEADTEATLTTLGDHGHRAWVLGRLVPGAGTVRYLD